MSVSIKRVGEWLTVLLLPLALFVAAGVSVWWARGAPVDDMPSVPVVPMFQFRAPEDVQERDEVVVSEEILSRNPFGTVESVTPDETEVMPELREIHLELIVVTETARSCLVNGRIMREGQQEHHFSVLRIERQRVWFRTGKETFMLAAGERVGVTPEGGRQPLPEDVEAESEEISGIK